MTKLSEAQRRVLEAMRDGRNLQVPFRLSMKGWLVWPSSFRGAYGTKVVRGATIRKLVELSLIAPEYGRSEPPCTYALTPTGRAALLQGGVGEE